MEHPSLSAPFTVKPTISFLISRNNKILRHFRYSNHYLQHFYFMLFYDQQTEEKEKKGEMSDYSPFTEAMEQIHSELERLNEYNQFHYGNPFTTFQEAVFPPSEKMAMMSGDLSETTIHQSEQVSVMYHQCFPSSEEYQGYAYMLGHEGKHSIAFRFRDESEASAYHLHSYIEIIYVYRGWMTEMIEGERFCLKEKQICILNRNCRHRDLRSESEGITFFLGLRPSAFNTLLLNGLKKSAVREFLVSALRHKQKASHFQLTVNAEDASVIERNLGGLLDELLKKETGYTQMISVLLLRILNTMGNASESQLISSEIPFRKHLKYHALMEYIEQNLAEISIDNLCSTFHYQQDYYNRIIRRHTGLTFAAYVQKLRMEKAKHLLSSTDLSAGEIGWQVGYKNPGYFFRVFKEKTGMTPLEYRKKNF